MTPLLLHLNCFHNFTGVKTIQKSVKDGYTNMHTAFVLYALIPNLYHKPKRILEEEAVMAMVLGGMETPERHA